MTWAELKANIFSSPKSTITGVCGAAVAIILALMALPPKASVPVVALAVLRALIDFTKTDAGKTIATTPSNPTPHAVDSTETPIDPAATPVIK